MGGSFMSHCSLFRALSICTVSSILIAAQTPQKTSQPPAQTNREATQPRQNRTAPPNTIFAETDETSMARRMTAVLLLTNLADKARGFRDQALRSRVHAKVADALWQEDELRARQIFRQAWDEVEEFGRDTTPGTNREKSEKGKAFISNANLRNEVLRLVALRDPKLAEEFLYKLNEKAEPNATNTRSEVVAAPLELTPAELGRVDLARQLLTSGNTDRALELAGPMLNRVTEQTVRFLSLLRLGNPDGADNQFALLLARSSADPSADAITISFLSSYVLSPLFFVSVTREGFTNSSQYGRPLPPPELSPTLRASFFRSAAQVLLRPLPPEDQDRTAAGRPGTYFTILRLLPSFEKFAPEYVPLLRTQLAILSKPIYSEIFNPDTNQHLTKGLTASKKVADGSPEQFDPSKAQSTSERDSIYANAAQSAAAKGDERARDYADKIDDSELRRQTRAYTDFVLLTGAIEAKQLERVARLVRSDFLTNFERAWALAEAGQLLKKEDPSRAAEFLAESVAEARRIDETSPDRVRALIAIASQLYEIDPSRTWEMANEIVSSANKSKDFTGEDSRIIVRLTLKGTRAEKSFSPSDINLSSLFGRLAKEDMYVAINIANDFAAEGSRATALISIARAILDEPRLPPGRR
jgi:hypothetical protein